MAYSYEDVIPTLVPNTTMQKMILDGVHRSYVIAPIEGYVLHDKNRDWNDIDPVTGMPSEEPTLGYTTGTATCGANYDFTTVQVTDENGVTHTAYGAKREFFARPASEVPADKTEGGLLE